MKSHYHKHLNQIKKIVTTKEGLIAWGIANVITSLHWAIPLILGFIFNNTRLMAISATTFAIGMSPFIPLWIINVFITVFIWKKIYKKKDLN